MQGAYYLWYSIILNLILQQKIIIVTVDNLHNDTILYQFVVLFIIVTKLIFILNRIILIFERNKSINLLLQINKTILLNKKINNI